MIRPRIKSSFLIILVLYLFYLSSFFFSTVYLGVMSREISGLPGIFFSFFIHNDFNHLLHNSIPLLFLLLILSVKFDKSFWFILLSLILGSGFLTWLFGGKGIHIGASGVIYALTSFLIIQTFLSKKLSLLFPLLIFLFYYSGIFSGLIPNFFFDDNISYSGHWMGVVAGIGVAWLFRKQNP